LVWWASSKVANYSPKTFPQQLGPFGLQPTSLDPSSLTLNLQPEVGVFTYQAPLTGDGHSSLAELGRRFGDLVMDIGQLSPPHAITHLSSQARRFANIPPEATTVRAVTIIINDGWP
jgi:hypothetical protein